MASPILALPWLYDQVVARFDAENLNVPQAFGWREARRAKSAENKLVWVPGAPGGDVGELGAARHPGGNPRSLATLGEVFHVWIMGADRCDPENERKQYNAARLLYDAWYRATYLAAHGVFFVESQTWDLSKNERRHGAAIVVVATIESKVADLPYTTAPADTGAVIDIEIQDQTDQIFVPAP